MSRRSGHAVLALTTLVLAGVAPAAWGNGRPPQTNGVFFKPNDPATILVRTTFGLLISKDEGCSFRWVCEKSIGYGGEFDPKYAVASDGTLFATTFTGLRVSRDGGCTWVTATAETPATDPGHIADIWIDALDISATGEVWVATAESARPNNVYSSKDNGVTFQPRGMASPTIWWKSIKTARTNPQRVYVTGYQVAGTLPDGGQSPPTAHLLRSDDAGANWNELSLAAMMFGSTPIVMVSAVDPTDPDTLIVTSIGANAMGDRVYRSTDAGATFTEVTLTSQPVKDVLFAADGTVIVATLGGSFKSTDRGATFTALPNAPQLQCIGQRSDGQLVGCGANWDPDFKAVALSADDASTWTKLFRFVELAGPIACPADTPNAQMCDPLWPTLQEQFGATGPTNPACALPQVDGPPPPKPPGGCCDANAGGGAALGALALLGWIVVVSRPRRRR
ncbi:MAG TPA: sialidase family protein [Kofleriaceae bacterium]|nr:sialidase family protein [Kofleriaceae bacterium]